MRIGGEVVPRTEVLQWEARRLQVAAQRLEGAFPGWLLSDIGALLLRPAGAIDDVARDRVRLVDAKLRLGEAEMRKLTATDLAASTPIAQLAAMPKRWAVSTTTVTSNIGTAKGFARWFDGRIARNDVRAMLVACPDHYVIRTPQTGRQEVIEVTGGAVLASRFLIDYAEVQGLPIAVDPRADARAAGWARNGRGTRIGAVHHQFRDNRGGGFTADLAVAFPAFVPSYMVSEHRWHLACEFSNWVSAYARTL